MDKNVKYIIMAVVAIMVLALVLLAVAGAIALVVYPLFNDATAPVAPAVTLTVTPMPVPASDAQIIGQALEAQESMPSHHVSGKAFYDNTHTVLITSDTGTQVWASTGEDGTYKADIKTTGKSFTVSVYENNGATLVYTSKWYLFSPSGSDVVDVDSANM